MAETGSLDLTRTILELVQLPFWRKSDFWISTGVSFFGLIFSIMAYREARKAKKAATEAGQTVKIQTVAIELTEMLQKLDNLYPEILFSEARDLLNEIDRRLRRATSPFQKDTDLSETIIALRTTLEAARSSLNSVRPEDPAKEKDVPSAVYYAIQNDFAQINNIVADLLGLCEKKTMHIGGNNG